MTIQLSESWSEWQDWNLTLRNMSSPHLLSERRRIMHERKIEQCLQKARECDALAGGMRDQLAKYPYEDLGRKWLELAALIQELSAKIQRLAV
jgi:hypothetical protein